MPGSALVAGAVAEIEWQGNDLLVYRTKAGLCQAITAYCPHMAPGNALIYPRGNPSLPRWDGVGRVPAVGASGSGESISR